MGGGEGREARRMQEARDRMQWLAQARWQEVARKSVGLLWYPFEVEAPSFLPLPLPPPIFSLDGSLLSTVRY